MFAARHVAAENKRQHFLRALDESLGPACLLGLEGRHLDRQFRRAFDVLEIFEPPSLDLRAIAEIGVFGQRIVLPAAGIFNRLPTPHAGGAIEVEEDALARTAAVLEHEVSIQQDGFDFGKKRVIAIDVRPAGLHHSDLRVGEVVNDLHQEVGRRREVGVEDGDELTVRDLHARLQGARFEALAIRAVEISDGVTHRGVTFHDLRATSTVSSVESSSTWMSSLSLG